jgi:hypothetical protein
VVGIVPAVEVVPVVEAVPGAAPPPKHNTSSQYQSTSLSHQESRTQAHHVPVTSERAKVRVFFNFRAPTKQVHCVVKVVSTIRK